VDGLGGVVGKESRASATTIGGIFLCQSTNMKWQNLTRGRCHFWGEIYVFRKFVFVVHTILVQYYITGRLRIGTGSSERVLCRSARYAYGTVCRHHRANLL
jgi:hypothetical protein